MEFLEKHNLTGKNIFKLAILGFIALVAIAFIVQIIGSVFNGSKSNLGRSYSNDSMSLESAGFGMAQKSMELSVRNSMPAPTQDSGSMGDDAEDFEVTEYNARIETRHLEKDCQLVSSLKAKDYVIFENANQSDHNCNYTFKVKTDNRNEVLTLIKSLDPKDLDENTRTIKKLIDDYTSELDILNKKRTTIEKTLNDAINSYDQISQVATRANDAESLSKIIDSKIRIIERLSQERITISSQIDRINRSKAEQIDRLEYTYFYVNIYENKYVDVETIKDSWKSSVKQFVRDVNNIAQNVSINLVTVILTILQYVLYLLIILLVGKGVWKIAKRIYRN